MGGGDRIRLFCALLLPVEALDGLCRWQAEHLRGEQLRGARVVPRANLHVTLAFLGGRSEAELPAIAGELRAAAHAAAPVALEPGRYRETASVGMVVLTDATGAATALAGEVGERLERIGAYRRERRPWLPHVTVLRFRVRPQLAPPPPPLGRVVPSDAAVMVSFLRPGGARYEVLEQAVLGGR